MATKISRGGSIAQGLTGSGAWRGLSTVLSGTASLVVSASAAKSGASIFVQPTQFATFQNSGQFTISTIATSVAQGSFTVLCSTGPSAPLNIAWFVLR